MQAHFLFDVSGILLQLPVAASFLPPWYHYIMSFSMADALRVHVRSMHLH